MYDDVFRDRLIEAADRVADRTGVDPLDLRRSMAITTDARLELLPRSVGLGLGVFAVVIMMLIFGWIGNPADSPSMTVTATLMAMDIAMFLGVATCLQLARAARSRRAENDMFEDAWAKLAVEVWPPPRYQSWDGSPSSGAGYSRTEFLMAVQSGKPLDDFARRAPLTRMP